MYEFFAATLSFPTVVFTVLLLVACAYWGLVILGALGIDVLDFDADGGVDGAVDGAVDGVADGALEGVADGAAEGVAEGVAEGAAEGAAEAAAEGATEGAADGASEGAGNGIAGTLIAAIKVKDVPVTVVLSLVVLYGWIITQLTTQIVLMGAGLDSGLIRGALFVGAGIFSLPLANLTARPLGSLLKEEVAMSRKDIIGKVVVIDTSRVDARFGTAKFDDGAAGLVLQVRCDHDNTLARGSQALVTDWDDAREAYEVAPMDDILPDRQRSLPGKN